METACDCSHFSFPVSLACAEEASGVDWGSNKKERTEAKIRKGGVPRDTSAQGPGGKFPSSIPEKGVKQVRGNRSGQLRRKTHLGYSVANRKPLKAV